MNTCILHCMFCQDLPDYLRGFMYTVACMQTPDHCERVAYEFAEDCAKDGVCYVEVRFAPQLLANVRPFAKGHECFYMSVSWRTYAQMDPDLWVYGWIFRSFLPA